MSCAQERRDCLVEHDIRSVVEVAHEYNVTCKVIIETALLTDDEKVRACRAAKAAGADFVKTSTGFSKGGATVADIALMRRTVGADLGVKASGGVKGLEDARAWLKQAEPALAPVGVKIAQEAAGHKTGSALWLIDPVLSLVEPPLPPLESLNAYDYPRLIFQTKVE